MTDTIDRDELLRELTSAAPKRSTTATSAAGFTRWGTWTGLMTRSRLLTAFVLLTWIGRGKSGNQDPRGGAKMVEYIKKADLVSEITWREDRLAAESPVTRADKVREDEK